MARSMLWVAHQPDAGWRQESARPHLYKTGTMIEYSLVRAIGIGEMC